MAFSLARIPALARAAPTAARRVAARAEPATTTRVFTDAEWDAAVQTASETLKVMRAASAEVSGSEEGAAPKAAVPANRVFSDEEWAAAIEAASASLAATQAVESGMEAAAEGTPAAAATSTPAAPRVVPEGRVFTDEEWAEAIELASAALAASRGESVEGEGSPSAPAPEGRIFSDAEWDAALDAALAASAAAKSGEAVEGASDSVFTDAEWAEAIEKAAKIQSGEWVEPEVPTMAFGDAMAVGGPVPEAANGRVAMIGFVAAVAAEISSGSPVAAQFNAASPGLQIFVAAFAAASLFPALAGKADTEMGPFTSKAEALNGRAAMVGLSALFAIEAATGSALF